MLHPDAALALRARLAWAHDWVSDPTLAATFETVPGAGFTVAGAKPVANAALISSGAELHLADGATIGARFDGEFASRASIYAGTAIFINQYISRSTSCGVFERVLLEEGTDFLSIALQGLHG